MLQDGSFKLAEDWTSERLKQRAEIFTVSYNNEMWCVYMHLLSECNQ